VLAAEHGCTGGYVPESIIHERYCSASGFRRTISRKTCRAAEAQTGSSASGFDQQAHDQCVERPVVAGDRGDTPQLADRRHHLTCCGTAAPGISTRRWRLHAVDSGSDPLGNARMSVKATSEKVLGTKHRLHRS
jgi:hypothetical protein